ncbi:hypothetical protein [Actinophytocola sp.]|uniref:hypothetical protein n=1 Tax=Actinophytocola sp. TaxID=1872138 RepID=UPI002EDB6669
MRASRPSVRVELFAQLAGRVDELGLRRGRPVVVLVGGAGGMGKTDLGLVDGLLREAVFPLLDRLDAVVVDGGTDSGVMRVAGRALHAVGARFPLLGVVATGTVGADGDGELEPYHTHTLLVPGATWGDESPWLAGVASVIAGGEPSVTLVVNGGAITYDDIARSLDLGRPILVVAGTGRTADAVAEASAGRLADPRAAEVAASPLTTVVDIADRAAITAALETALAKP